VTYIYPIGVAGRHGGDSERRVSSDRVESIYGEFKRSGGRPQASQ
jgi:hypothetical protein